MRDWWLRTFLVLQRPRPVFVALRDESKQSLGDRSEPVLALIRRLPLEFEDAPEAG